MRQQKISMFGGLTPAGADGSSTEVLNRLAGLTSQIQDTVFNIAAKKRETEGAQKGQLAGIEAQKTGKKLELEDAGISIHDQAFNQGAMVAYKAQLDIDSKTKLDDLQREFQDDPEGFKKQAESYKAGTLENLPPALFASASLDLDAAIANRASQVKDAFFKKEKERHFGEFTAGMESISDDLSNAARAGKTDQIEILTAKGSERISEALKAGIITPAQAEGMLEGAKETVIEQSALGEIDRVIFNENLSLEQQAQKGVNFLEQLRANPAADLDAAQNETLRNVIGAKVAGLQKQLEAERSKVPIETQRDISTLEVAINLDAGDPEKLAEMTEGYFNKGLITQAKRTELLTKLGKNQIEGAKKKIDFGMVAKKLNGDSPEIVISQKQANAYYEEEYLPQIDDLSDAEKNLYKADYIEKLKVVPEGIKRELNNAVLSRDPELIKGAADIIDRIDHIPGLPDLALSTSDRAFIENVNRLSINMAPEQAIDLATKLTDPTNEARIKARESEIKAEKMEVGGFIGSGYKDIVNTAFEGFWGNDRLKANINLEQMTSEYKDLFEAAYKAGTPKDRAEEIAINKLRANWKESEFGFMRNPPEDYYSVAGSVEYVRKQLNDDINKDFIGIEFKKENIFLLSDDETAMKASRGEPDYKVMILDNNGEFQKLKDRWMPDKAKEVERQIKINEKEALIEREGAKFTPEASIKMRRIQEAKNAVR